MTKSDFTKVTLSDECLYGPRKLLLCGFSPENQSKFKTLLQMLEFEKIPVVWVSDRQSENELHELLALPDGHGRDQSSNLPRALIVCGVTQKELHRLMNGCRQSGMQKALWAVLTPTSEQWTIRKLLAELAAEHKALSK